MQQQHGAISKPLREADDERENQQQLRTGQAEDHSISEPAQAVEVLEDRDGVAWAHEFIDGPHEHHEEYRQPQHEEDQSHTPHIIGSVHVARR